MMPIVQAGQANDQTDRRGGEADRPESGLPVHRRAALDRAQVIVAFIPSRDWAGLSEWVRLSATQRLDRWSVGSRTMAVRQFDHSSLQPLVALLLREGSASVGYLAAACRGRHQPAADLSQLILHEAVALPLRSAVRRISRLRESVCEVHPELRRFFPDAILSDGGLLPPTTSQEVIGELRQHHADIIDLLASKFPADMDSLAAANAHRRFVFQQQRDAALLALRIAGIEDTAALVLTEPANLERSFLDQLPQTHLSEEQILRRDAEQFPGLRAIPGVKVDQRTFVSGNRRLDLVFAHRERLEPLTGADFIYFNVTFGSFVLVQYKLMNEDAGREFYRIDDHMRRQMKAMRGLVPLPNPAPDSEHDREYRFSHEACFWKFVSRYADLEADESLIPGYYLPLSLLTKCVQQGSRGGELIEPEKLPRTLSNTTFALLVRDAWAGSAGAQSDALQRLIEATLSDNRGVTLAVHATRNEPSEPRQHVTTAHESGQYVEASPDLLREFEDDLTS